MISRLALLTGDLAVLQGKDFQAIPNLSLWREPMERKEYHVVIDRDDEGNPVYNLTKPNRILDAIVAAGHMGHWSFLCSLAPGQEFMVYIYNGPGRDVPQGENLEEVNRQAVACILKSGG
jgi:hypothetical protein